MEFRKDNNGDGKGDNGAEMHRTAQNFVIKEQTPEKTDVDKVIEKINSLPTNVTLDDKNTILAARSAYNALSNSEKTQVVNYKKLESAENKIKALEETVANQTAADNVITKIKTIPTTITSEAKTKIQAARTAYNSLTENQKKLVTNYEKLVSAETALAKYEALQADKAKANNVITLISSIPSTITSDAKDEIQAARTAYDALTEAQKSYVSNYKRLTDAETALKQYDEQQEQALKDKNTAGKVVELISSLPVNTTLEDKENIDNARTAYNALTASQKGYVTNYSKLVSAEEKISQLELAAIEQAKINSVIATIDLIPEDLSLKNKDKVEIARKAYDALTSEQKAKVINYTALLNAEKAIEALEAQEEATKEDKKAAEKVIKLINDLPEDIKQSDKMAIEAVRDAYEKLSSNQKMLVSNLDRLTDAEKVIKTLEDYEEANKNDKTAADKVIALIDTLPTNIKINDKALVEKARTAYNTLTEKQKEIVTNYDVLTEAEVKLAELENKKYDEKQYVTFVGILVDKEGKAYTNRTIEIHSFVQSGKTDENGSFQFNNVEFGKHSITVKNEYGKEVAQSNFNITLGASTCLSGNDIVANNGSIFTVKMQVNGESINFLSIEEGNHAPVINTDDKQNDNSGIDIGQEEVPEENKTDEGIDIGDDVIQKEDKKDDGIYIGEDGKGFAENKEEAETSNLIPQTGDETNITFWVTVLIISLFGLVTMITMEIRNKKKAKQI